MKLIVGLGNPGRKYENTRHNLGFACVGAIARSVGAGPGTGKFDAELQDVVWGVERLLLVRPLTFMNLSGQSVRRFVDFYRLPLSQLLVICDDLSLPVGTIRLRATGSSGGQKGLQNICDVLGSIDVPRLRLGIGAAPPEWDAADYVLARVPAHEREMLDQAVQAGCEAALVWAGQGISAAMNRFNRNPASEIKPPDDAA
jgi:peptidyl-tRNA hydrolase, PTH1 family